MKKVLALLLVLGLASAANAALVISVNGLVDPPDTEVWLQVSEHAVIDVHADGGEPYFGGALFCAGPGFLQTTVDTIVWGDGGAGDVSEQRLIDEGWIDGLADMGYPGVTSVVEIAITDQVEPFDPMPQGIVVDLLDFHCTGPGDVIIGLMDGDTFEVLDVQVIHQEIPEPATMGLLGLGGLALLRRRR